MADGYYLAVVKELKRLGFAYRENAKGSHEKWADATGRTLIVPKTLKSRHTANGILREAGSTLHF